MRDLQLIARQFCRKFTHFPSVWLKMRACKKMTNIRYEKYGWFCQEKETKWLLQQISFNNGGLIWRWCSCNVKCNTVSSKTICNRIHKRKNLQLNVPCLVRNYDICVFLRFKQYNSCITTYPCSYFLIADGFASTPGVNFMKQDAILKMEAVVALTSERLW